MTGEVFHDAMGFIDDDLIEEAARFRARRVRPAWQRLAAMAACVCIAACGVFVWSRYGARVESDTTGATDGGTPMMAVQETYGEVGAVSVEILDVRYEYGPVQYGDDEPDGVKLVMRSVVAESVNPSGDRPDTQTLRLKVTERGARHEVKALVPAGEGQWELIVTRHITDGGGNNVLVGIIEIDIPAGIVGADDTITVTWNEEE